MRNLCETILTDMERRDTGLKKPHKKGLASLVTGVIFNRTPNLMVIGDTLDRPISNRQDRYQYVRRVLANKKINIDRVMGGYVPELIEQVCQMGEIIILMMDQSKMGENLECLMVSIRVGERALPLLWRVKETQGNIGYETQKELLDAVIAMLPTGVQIILMADRFYGGASLVKWCQAHKWGYRIRLKGNLHMNHQGGLLVTGECLKMGLTQIEGAKFNGTNVETNIGIIFEEGHPEPWIIAMDCKPNKYTTLDYGMRWGIEPMFSDYKSRGFEIRKTHLIHSDRLERLILVMSIALYWAVSTGMYDEQDSDKHIKKNVSGPLFHFLPEVSLLY
jgi:hypothetical protein